MLEMFESRPEIERILHHFEIIEDNIALNLINKLKKSDLFTKFLLNQKLLIFFYEMLIYNNLDKFGQFVDLCNIMEYYYEDNSDTADNFSLFILYYFKIYNATVIRKFESAKEFISKSFTLLSIVDENQNDPNILKVSVHFYYILGLFYSGIKDPESVKECLSKAINISMKLKSCYYIMFFQRDLRELQNKHDIFRINADIEIQENFCFDPKFRGLNYIILSSEFFQIGRLKEALSFINQAFELTKNIILENEMEIKLIYYCNFRKGLIYSKMGDYKEAIKFLTKALENSELINERYNNPIGIMGTLNIIGDTYLKLGQDDLALDYIIKVNKLIIKEPRAISYVSNSYYLFILLYLKMGNVQKAESVFLKMDELYNTWKYFDHPETELTVAYRNIAHALLLMETKSFKTYSQAQEILAEIVSNTHLRKDVITEALLPLISLRLNEFKTFQTKQSLGEFTNSLMLLKTVADQQNSIPLRIQSDVLHAKMYLVQGEFDRFEKFLDKAKELAIEYNRKTVVDWIDAELADFQEQYQTWKSLIASDSPLINRFEKVSIENYIKDVRSLLGYKK